MNIHQEMEKMLKAMESKQNAALDLFENVHKKGQMGSNVFILIFLKKDYQAGVETAKLIEADGEVKVTFFDDKNRISLIF